MKDKQYCVTLMVNGKRKYYRGNTLREAEEKRDADKILLLKGVDIGNNITFQQLATKWFVTYKKGQLHIRSEETILGILNRYILPVIGDDIVKNIKPIDIQVMMNKVSKLSASTQKKVLQYTKAIFQVGIENDIIAKIPIGSETKVKGKASAEVEPLTDEQCTTLFKATKGTRVYPFLIVLRFCGLRKGEALGLKWDDIDFENGLLHVQRSVVYPLCNRKGEINEDMKTESADRVIPLNDIVISVLTEEKSKSKSPYVFSGKDKKFLSESSFRKMWELIDYRKVKNSTDSSRIEKTIDFDVHPHQLRHTCVTAWFESGLDIKEVQYLAGHATPEITMRIYTHYRSKQRFQSTSDKIKKQIINFEV